MGNKHKLMRQLKPLFPKECDVFVDLFGGSGVVSMNYEGKKRTIYNEINHNIVEMIKMIVNNEPKQLDEYWKSKVEFYNLPKQSTKRLDLTDEDFFNERQKNYNKMRDDYNRKSERDYRDLFLLSCYSINHLIRFNSNSEFNVSSGADSYNNNNYYCVCNMNKKFKDVEIVCGDAFDFGFDSLTEKDFVYCDIPYLNTEAVYNEQRAFGGWDIDDDYKLFKVLEQLDARGVRWGLSNVFENRGKSNEHLIEWCNSYKWNVYHLDRNYNPFSRGNSDNDEVYICNYDTGVVVYKQVSMFD